MPLPDTTDSKYTIRTANQTLPLVKMIVQDIVALSKEIEDTRQRLADLSFERDESKQNEYDKELISIEHATDLKSEKLERVTAELGQLNVLDSAVSSGFVDFPATRENEPVCLCWHLGDKEVMYWHRIDEPCSERRLVDLPLIRQSADRRFTPTA